MKKTILAIALIALSMNAMATSPSDKSSTTPEVLQINTFGVRNGVTVQLPTLKMADGTVCQSYVASVSKNVNKTTKETRTDVTIDKICDKPYVVKNYSGFGLREMDFPAKLKALQTFTTSDGISIQIPNIDG